MAPPEPPAGGGLPWPWLAAGVAALLLVGTAAVLLVIVRRRRSRAATAGAAAVLLLLAVVVAPAVVAPRPAAAVINVHDSLADAWNACLANLTMAGGDPASILPALNDPGVTINIIPTGGDETHHSAVSPDEHFIFWDPDDDHRYFGSGGPADGCSSLYHELYHAYDSNQGTINQSECVTAAGPTGIPESEVNATRVQNQLRAKLGLPQRSHYGDKPLPSGDCLPPEEQPKDPQCDGEGCGDSHGDPHLRTFDGKRWSFQAVGEFVAARNPAGGFEVQTRQEPVAQSRRVSVNTAVALDVAGDRVQIALAGRTGLAQRELLLTVDGEPREPGAVTLPAGGQVELLAGRRGPTMVVSWPDGSVATATAVGRGGIRLTVQPAADHAGELTGLLGDFDGAPDNDIRPAGGEPIADPDFDDLYPELADSWRVDEQTSLFAYEPGTGPETYADRSFPDADVVVTALPNRAAAEALCRRLGVTDPELLASCTLDVALTGLPDFAAAAAASQAYLEPLPEARPPTRGRIEPGELTSLQVTEPGGSVRVAFDAPAGQRVFVDVPRTTLPNACGVLRLAGPGDTQVTSGCVINGEGFVDAVELAQAGGYTLVLDPPGRDTGEAEVRVLFIADQRESIEPDGPAGTAEIDQPGVVARFSFPGTAGQKVFVDIPSTTLPNACSPLRVVAPDGSAVATGCVISGIGHIETATLPATGSYLVEVDPGGRTTGRAQVRLYAATDHAGTVEVGGAAVTATIAAPGDEAHLRFTGRAGQRVFVEASSSTLPSACGMLELLAPDGSSVATGCVVGDTGDIGGDDGVTLPVAGEYTLVVDPPDNGTGTVRLRLRT